MSRKKPNSASHVLPGFDRGNAVEVMDLIDDPQLGRHDFPPKVAAAIRSFAQDAYLFGVTELKSMHSLDYEQRLEFAAMLQYVAHMGFAMAVYRYAMELKDVPELVRWHRKRRDGADKGRTAQADRKQERQSRVQAMLNQGMDVPEIAKELGCSVATVYRLSRPAKATPTKSAKKRRRR
jgi:hypothetical protein